MTDVILTSQLTREGFRPGEIARRARRGELVHLRRGAWTSPSGPEAISVDRALRHRLLIAATVDQISTDAVLSHSSAAVLHGLPVWTPDLSTVHWTRTRPGGGRVRAQIHVYAAPLEADEIVLIDGQRVTSLERTVIDVARHLPFEQGVMTADAALHAGLDGRLLTESARRAVRRPGGARARRAVAFADGRSESPGESWSRVEFARMGKSPSDLQYEVRDERGVLIARSDFCWQEAGVVGEFDGKIKYGALLKSGQHPSDVVVAEKRREDAVRDQGWQVVRWVWNELSTPAVIAARLDRASARSSRRRT